MNYQAVNEKRMALVSLLSQFDSTSLDERSQACLARCIDRIREGRYRIAVFGDFSNGKSTLLNALMQQKEEILVVDELPSTAAITVIQAPPSDELENMARITFHDPDRKPELVPIKEARKYSAKVREANGAPVSDKVEDEIREVRLYMRSPLLDNGVEIIDTPGLNSAYRKHTEITRSIVDKSDATIFLFNFKQAGNQTEFNFIHLLSACVQKAFLAVNWIDEAFHYQDAEERINKVCEDLRDKLANQGVQLGERQVYPISAKLAFSAYGKEEPRERAKQLEKSRFEDFTDALQVYLCSPELERDKLQAPLKALRSELNTVLAENEASIRASQSSASELNEKLKEAENTLKELRSQEKSRMERMKEGIKKVLHEERVKLSGKTRTVQEDVVSQIEKRNTAYGIQHYLDSGGDFRQEAANGLRRAWEAACASAQVEITQVVSEVLLDEESFDAAEIAGLLSGYVKQSMDLAVDKPADVFTVDMSEITKMERDRDDKKRKLKENAEQIQKLTENAARRDKYQQDCARLAQEISRLDTKIEDLYQQKFRIQAVQYTAQETRFEPRGGILGKAVDMLIGEKRVEETVTKIDEETAGQNRMRLQSEADRNEQDREEKKRQYEERMEQIAKNKGLDFLLQEAMEERIRQRQEILKVEVMMEKKKDEMENQQVLDYQEQMTRDVKEIAEDFSGKAEIALGQIRKSVEKYIKRVISDNDTALKEAERTCELLVNMKRTTAEEREKVNAELARQSACIRQILAAVDDFKI